MPAENATKPPSGAPENPWINLGFNLILPVLLLTQGGRFIEAPAAVLVLALAFPLGYFFWDLWRRRNVNALSILGFVSVLLTGGIGLLELPRQWLIVKETAIPALIGLAVLVSRWTPFPIVRKLLFNPSVLDTEGIEQRLAERGQSEALQPLFNKANGGIAASFFLSAVLNYVLATLFLRTDPSVDAARFNQEVGAMTGWSYLVIALPSAAVLTGTLWWLIRRLTQLTGWPFERLLAPELRDKSTPPADPSEQDQDER